MYIICIKDYNSDIDNHGVDFIKGNTYFLEEDAINNEENYIEAEDGTFVAMDEVELREYFKIR